MEALVKEWLRLDREEGTSREIETLWKENDLKELESRLSHRLAFGTAGLRGQMGSGFSRMNSVTVIQTSQGLAEYLLRTNPEAHTAGVVIGHDARHNSEKFAKLAAAAFISKGIKVFWFKELVHTPLVPFTVKNLQTAAGVMITASHNPARDNGYKVYASNGCQIISPMDVEIAKSISENPEPITWEFPETSDLLKDVYSLARIDYNGSVKRYLGNPFHQKCLKFVYTPLHGVGLPFMHDLIDSVLPEDEPVDQTMSVVPQQAEPDPDFPTVRYPNPEEEGALDLAKAHADQNSISLILANDPDADRFAAAEKVNGQWRQFTGDQMGSLLVCYLLSKLQQHRKMTRDDIMLTTAVSSSMLSRISAQEGFTVEETLTGFKHLGTRALALTSLLPDQQSTSQKVHFAYEEALGYMFPSIVHDKDGIIAAGLFLKACTEWHHDSPSRTPWSKLQDLYARYGYFETTNTHFRSPSAGKTRTCFDSLRGKKTGATLIGGRRIIRWRDLASGEDDGVEGEKSPLPSSPDTMMITVWLSGAQKGGYEGETATKEGNIGGEEGTRFTVRASGTEPKIKLYLECWGHEPDKTRESAREILKTLKKEWFGDPELVIEEKYRDL